MITYEDVLKELEGLSEEKFAAFQRRIIRDDKLKIAGVRTPALRALAKKYKGEYEAFSHFSDEFYEVVFLKLSLAAALPYEEFIAVSDDCVALISDWALCDCFAPACIKKHREDYVPFIKKYLTCTTGYSEGEYVRRFALTTLLHFYVEEKYLDLIFDCVKSCRQEKYYVMMGAAWLLAEVLIKQYERGFEYLNSTMCDINIKNKAISKACDSFRLTDGQKEQLKALRVKRS